MNVDHKVILIDNLTFLKENITLTEPTLLDRLLQAAVLDQREVAEVRSKVTDHERTDQLLQYILRSSHEQYQQFLGALNESNHQHVYNRLTGIICIRIYKYIWALGPAQIEWVNFCLVVIHKKPSM